MSSPSTITQMFHPNSVSKITRPHNQGTRTIFWFFGDTELGYPSLMRLTPSSASVLTAIATTASVYITRSITNENVSQINPLFAAIGGFVIPAYAINVLSKSRVKPKNPQKLVTIFAAAIVLPVLAILWIGNRDHAYKVQMGTMFVVLGVCAIAFIPAALKATKSDDL